MAYISGGTSHEFQALFQWHVADQGIRHVYIKARTLQLNGKVERSHRTDQQEFYHRRGAARPDRPDAAPFFV